jgi:hypothetical protein
MLCQRLAKAACILIQQPFGLGGGARGLVKPSQPDGDIAMAAFKKRHLLQVEKRLLLVGKRLFLLGSP